MIITTTLDAIQLPVKDAAPLHQELIVPLIVASPPSFAEALSVPPSSAPPSSPPSADMAALRKVRMHLSAAS